MIPIYEEFKNLINYFYSVYENPIDNEIFIVYYEIHIKKIAIGSQNIFKNRGCKQW